MTEETQAPAEVVEAPLYKDDDLVYVDPELKLVIGIVEWSNNGRPKSRTMQKAVAEDPEEGDKEKKGRPHRLRNYPWGTYRSMKRVFKLEGKRKQAENQKTLDEVIEKALNEPFWD